MIGFILILASWFLLRLERKGLTEWGFNAPLLRARQLLVGFLVAGSVVACAGRREPASDPQAAAIERSLVGQLLLPSGVGSRGVEILVSVEAKGDAPPVVWLLFNEQGSFDHSFRERVISVSVQAGINAEVHRIERQELPEADQAGRIDLGVIDLRDRLTKHRMLLNASSGKLSGDVRIGMWKGKPALGPQGEPVSLGSRQFSEVSLGSELEWLIPNEAHSIYFLVEQPGGPGRGRTWRSGPQQLFGPFRSSAMPTKLTLE